MKLKRNGLERLTKKGFWDGVKKGVFAAEAASVFKELSLDELKGSKPTKSIDLSGKGAASIFTPSQKIGVASSIIIAACIKDNAPLETLK